MLLSALLTALDDNNFVINESLQYYMGIEYKPGSCVTECVTIWPRHEGQSICRRVCYPFLLSEYRNEIWHPINDPSQSEQYRYNTTSCVEICCTGKVINRTAFLIKYGVWRYKRERSVLNLDTKWRRVLGFRSGQSKYRCSVLVIGKRIFCPLKPWDSV